MRLILASASPRRAELLTAAGFSFETCVTDVDERVWPNESPREYVRRLAIEKAARAWEMTAGPAEAGPHANHVGSHADHVGSGFSRTRTVIVIGADTAVVVDDEILGKPLDRQDGERMLRRLAGRTHTVMTGVSVRSAAGQLDGVDETLVYVQPLTPEQVAWYVDSGEGRDKAGGYGIQGLASRFIPRIEGSYSNVVGLPVALVHELMVRQGGSIPI